MSSETPGTAAPDQHDTIGGVGVTPGRVLGRVRRMPDPVAEPAQNERAAAGTEPAAERDRLAAATAATVADLTERAGQAAPDAAAVLRTTAMMAGDPALVSAAGASIDGGASAERAIWDAAATIADQLVSLGGYMAERATDVLDVRSRIVSELRGLPAPGVPQSDEPFVLVARDLAPADTATLSPESVLALVTSEGGPQSHTAIIARAIGLPAIVAATGAASLADGTEVFVDGAAGTIQSPPPADAAELAAGWVEQQKLAAAFDGAAAYADGTPVELLANVGGPSDALLASSEGARGVGLFRTEFCFLGRDQEPSVQEQVREYRAVFDAFPGQKVVVRTLDAGADKPLPFVTDDEEPNPALGVRGYRTSVPFPAVLEHQLQAIVEAASDSAAEVRVMAPMISTPLEAEAFAELCGRVGVETNGVMIEVPSAAVRAGQILERVDFLSIGTNDLTQYTMAADRQLGPLSAYNDPWQPAVLDLVKLTADAGAARGADAGGPASVGVCGEAAADPALAVVLLGLGVTSLSMTARALGRVAAVVATVTPEDAARLAALALAAPSAEAARDAVRAELPILDELGL